MDYTKRVIRVSKKTDEFLESSISNHQSRLEKAIRELENRIISEVKEFKTTDSGKLMGPRVNLKLAQKIHSKLTTLFDETYGESIRSVVRGFKTAQTFIKRSFDDLNIAAEFTSVDKDVLKTLQKSTWNTFNQFGLQVQEKLVDQMYSAIVGGIAFTKLVDGFRELLSGIPAKRGTMDRYAKLYAHDATMNFHTEVTMKKARDAGVNSFLYYGNLMNTSRKFCIDRVGKIFTREEIESWNELTWQGKSGPPLVNRGGYNCRHSWVPVLKSKVDTDKFQEEMGVPKDQQAEVIPKKGTSPIRQARFKTPDPKTMSTDDPSWISRFSFNMKYNASLLKARNAELLGHRIASLPKEDREDIYYFYKEMIYDLKYGPDDPRSFVQMVSDLNRSWAATSADADRTAIFLQQMAKEEFGLEDAFDEHFDISTVEGLKKYFETMKAQNVFDVERVKRGARKYLRQMYEQTQEYLANELGNRKTITLYRGFVYDPEYLEIINPEPLKHFDEISERIATYNVEIEDAEQELEDLYIQQVELMKKEASSELTDEEKNLLKQIGNEIDLHQREIDSLYEEIGNVKEDRFYSGRMEDIGLQPMSSFSANYRTAEEFALGGEVQVIVAAEVPVERIIATPASGFGCLSESEFVVLGGRDVVYYTMQPGVGYSEELMSLGDEGLGTEGWFDSLKSVIKKYK